MTKRVGLAAPHPAAHKCAIVPFAPVKCFFKNVFAESQHKFAKQGASAQKREQQLNFFRYSAREMFHTRAQMKHYILWSARPPYLQKDP